MGWIAENNFSVQVLIIAAVMSSPSFRQYPGVGKGVKVLSRLNLGLAFCCCFCFGGATVYLLSAFGDNIEFYRKSGAPRFQNLCVRTGTQAVV